MLDLSSIPDIILDIGTKGLPAHVSSIRLDEAVASGWRLHEDLQLPAAILRRSALDNNSAWMKAFVEQFGVAICPHGKTTMAPQLFDRQLRDGAWGITCATLNHLKVYRAFGVDRILFANQVASSRAAEWIARELAAYAAFELTIFVDSVEGIDLLAQAARTVGLDRPISLLLEVGFPDGRTGVRDVDAALALAEHIDRQRPHVRLSGLATFEGSVPGGTDVDMEPHVTALFERMRLSAEAIAKRGLVDREMPVILSAGGSRFFDLAATVLRDIDVGGDSLVVLRSGCYISHDAHHYEHAFERLLERRGGVVPDGRLVNALEIWAQAQSRPEPGWLFANLGKRDISHDMHLPDILGIRSGRDGTVIRQPPVTVAKLSDQHAHLMSAHDAPWQVGDHIGFGISHPCTTFDKWKFLFEVDDNDVVVDIIATFF